jgi:hypothetical protein
VPGTDLTPFVSSKIAFFGEAPVLVFVLVSSIGDQKKPNAINGLAGEFNAG